MQRAFFAVCLMFVVVPSVSSTAQDAKPNFSGKWTLDLTKSDFGPAPAPDSIVSVIDHKDPVLKVVTTQKGQQGELTNDRNLTTDGKENTNKFHTMAGDQDVTSTTRWDGTKLAIAFKLDVQGGVIDVNDSWELSDAGKVLTITRNLKTDQGTFTQKLVFNKQ